MPEKKKKKIPLGQKSLTSMISVHGSFQSNFLGFRDSIMKFLFVLG